MFFPKGMTKSSYEFVDLSSQRERELGLEEREEQERKRRFKVCPKCKTRKSLFYFAEDKRNSDGKTGECLACRSKRALSYYYENREKILIKIKEYQGKQDRRKYFSDYKRDHKEHLQKIARKWYRKNRKRIKKRNLERKVNLK